MLDPRQAIAHAIEDVVGRHDEPSLYAEPAGDPGLTGPGSVSWRLHGDVGTIAGAGLAALVLELLHPQVMAGVQLQSSYQTATQKRARATFGYVVVTTFAGTEAASALIARVRRIHDHISGVGPDGREYHASDPELLTWVHSAIPWAMLRSYERYRGPLPREDADRYLAEQAVIGRMGGAEDVPATVDELDAYIERMRGRLAVTEQTREFLRFVATGANPVERVQAELSLAAGLALLPDWARSLLGVRQPALARAGLREWARLNVKAIDWAFGVPEFRRLAELRV